MGQKKVIVGITLFVILGVVGGAIWFWISSIAKWEEITINMPELDVSGGQSSSLEVGIIGRQSYWTVWYPGEDEQFGTQHSSLVTAANTAGLDSTEVVAHDDLLVQGPFYLPVDQEIRLNISSTDVLHCVYIPHFRVKMDAVPGMPTAFSFTPTFTTESMRLKMENPEFEYEMACAEVCGKGHFSMHRTLRIVEEAEFRAWLKQQPNAAQQFRW